MDYVYYIILGVLLVGIVVMFVFSSRRRKKQEQDAQDLINSVKPGNKVKTIGGICGIVVEVRQTGDLPDRCRGFQKGRKVRRNAGRSFRRNYGNRGKR